MPVKSSVLTLDQRIQKTALPNFICTKDAISRVKKVINGIISGIPLLLEGETGTSKTKTAKQAAQTLQQKVITFNCSSQTTIDDLLGRVSKNNDSWSGFSFIKGPFTTAFEEGYCIILDEINLAHETVLQCIESSLDSRTLSLDYSGSEVDMTIQMHPNFHLIATQNPLSNRFSQKRNYLSSKFTSRFQIIKFEPINKPELLEIAQGLSKEYKILNNDLIKAIVDFHFRWQINSQAGSYFVFTIRDISRTLKSIKTGLTPYESILVNYGSRYNNKVKEEMKKQLKDLKINEEYKFLNNNTYINNIIKNFSFRQDQKIMITKKQTKFYLTETLRNVFSTCFHLFDNSQSILLIGPDGCGKTSIGRWIGELYSALIKKDESNYRFFICNPEMTIFDVIGRYVLYKQKGSSHERIINEPQIEWKYGPVVEAMMSGDCIVLDQIDTAPSTILERLNSLFDEIGVKDSKFTIQENLENPEVSINPNFRMIATSSLSGLNNISPAFLNRFTIIYVNEQLDSIEDQLNEFIRCMSPYASKPLEKGEHIRLLTSTIDKEMKNGRKVTSLNLSRYVNGFFKLEEKFKNSTNEDRNSILQFCLDSCINQTSTIPRMSENFIKVMLDNLEDDKENSTEFDAFHFKEALSTRKVMATLAACSIIGLHTILIGRTGIGKTAAAMAFSRTFERYKKNNNTHIISFNGETQLDDLYGYFTIENGNFTDHQGELSQAMSAGQVFIADELNLAEPQIIQSLNVAIEPSSGENIILPVTGSSIVIKEGFFFIGCQNDLTMNGRKPLPESIRKKILCINYPEPSSEDFTNICISIGRKFELDNAIPKCTAAVIRKINSDQSLRSWSLREVRILFRRIKYFKSKTQEVIGLTPMHSFAFMLISTLKNQTEKIKEIVKLVSSNFFQNNDADSLYNDLIAKVEVMKYIDGKLVSQSDIDSMKKNQEIKNENECLIRLKKGSLE